MPRLHIAFVLELYQPPTQGRETLEQVTNQCYAPLANLLAGEPRLRVTLSVTRSLIERLEAYGLDDAVIPAIAQAVSRGNVELAHSGAYHSIFPLLSDREVRRQIVLDREAKDHLFGATAPRGILPPELCYSDRLLPLFKDLGFRWTLVDDKLLHHFGIPIPTDKVYRIEDLSILFRSDLWSDIIRTPRDSGGKWTGCDFAAEMAQEAKGLVQDRYKVLMLPGETFGHHIPYFQETFLRDLVYALADHPDLCLATVSELLEVNLFPEVPPPPHSRDGFDTLPPSSLATQIMDWERGDPYPHFRSRGNLIHKRLWRLTDLILRVTDRLDLGVPDFRRLRDLLDSAFYSGQYFHASLWFWDKGPVLEGIDRQMRVLYEYARVTGDRDALRLGQRIYATLLWAVHNREQAEAAQGRGGSEQWDDNLPRLVEQWNNLPYTAQLVLVQLTATEAEARPGADDIYKGLDPLIRALVSTDSILDGLMTLQRQGLIRVEGDAHYRYRSDSLRRWVSARHGDPFDVVRTYAKAIVGDWTLADIARVQEAAVTCATPHWPSEAFGIAPAIWARATRIAECRSAIDSSAGKSRLARFGDYIEALADLVGATVRGRPEGQGPGPYTATIAFPGVAFQGFQDICFVFPGAIHDGDIPGALKGVISRGAHLPRILVVLSQGGDPPHGLSDAAAPADLALIDGAQLAATALSPEPRQSFLDALIRQIDIAALSPFKTAGPVRETFHGREAERRRILGYVLRQEGRGCAVIGPRRIGKTSLLLRVQDELRQDPDVEVQFLDASLYGSDLGGLLAAILQRIGGPSGPSDHAAFLAALRDRNQAYPHRRLALFIDEIDGLVAADTSQYAPFLKTLRAVTNELGVAVVIAGYEVLYDAMKDLHSPLFNHLEPLELGRLEEPAALSLVIDSLRHVYEIDMDLVRVLVTQAGLYPNFIQAACALLIARKGRLGDRTIHRNDILNVMKSRNLFDHMVQFYLANLDERTRAALFLLISLYDMDRGEFVINPELKEQTQRRGYDPSRRTKLSFTNQFSPYHLHGILELYGVSLDTSELQELLRHLILASVIAPIPDAKTYGFTLPDLPMVLRQHLEIEEQTVHYAERLVELFRPESPNHPPRSLP